MSQKLDEAASWHTRRREGLSAAETALFDLWIAEPENAAAFAQIDAGWRSFDAADADDIAALRTATRMRVRRRRFTQDLAKVAAAAVICLSAAGVYVSQRGVTYENAGRAPMQVDLADGSHLVLDAETKIRVRFDEGGRRVELERGQASFDVAHDPQRPFRVSAGSSKTTALGTRFNVDRWNGAETITLIEGRVSVEASSWFGGSIESKRLTPGQQVVVRSAHVSPVALAKADVVSAWQAGRLVFNDVSLDQAVASVNRYGAPRISLSDPTLGQLRVSGVFHSGDTDSFSRSVARLHGLEVGTSSEGVSLRSPN